ncbi:MAG: CBS domain-containing protein [Gammaproteobacteria bacterium]|nr:CBS domain-containing protein [Gammaproteobacteria bacterium]
MKHIPPVKSVMTPFPYSIDLQATATQALELMHKHAIRHLPVTDGGHALVGVVSEHDLKLLTRADDAEPVRVRDICTPEPYVVDLEEPLDNVLLVMAARHIGSALITRKGRLAGVFTATDACRSFGEHLRRQFRPGGGDEAA